MSAWKRNEQNPEAFASSAAPASPAKRSARTACVATVWPSITIEGDVKGEEDLIVEGKVAGKITVPAHTVTIGAAGHVKAQVRARSITIEGEVEGDLVAEEEVVIRPSGSVVGNIVSPRVTLESGCRFKGSIDMEKGPAAKKSEPRPAPKPEAAERSEKPTQSPVQPAIRPT